jgi:phage portal protein BeeE
VRIVPGLDGWPDGYEYSVNGQIARIAGEAVPGVARVLHSKLFHPANDHYGLSPIEAAATAVDIHNEASKWNKALLDNSARPSGALVYGNGQTMTAAQFERLKSELEETYTGARNAGRPMLLEGGLDWKAMSLSPRDMDFIALKQMAAREIALALGVPPMLLGIPGDNTYSNYSEDLIWFPGAPSGGRRSSRWCSGLLQACRAGSARPTDATSCFGQTWTTSTLSAPTATPSGQGCKPPHS